MKKSIFDITNLLLLMVLQRRTDYLANNQLIDVWSQHSILFEERRQNAMQFTMENSQDYQTSIQTVLNTYTINTRIIRPKLRNESNVRIWIFQGLNGYVVRYIQSWNGYVQKSMESVILISTYSLFIMFILVYYI